MRAAVAAVEEEHGAVGVLVNNAGYSQTGRDRDRPARRRSARSSRRTCSASSACASSCCPAMRAQRWGKIVNVSSMGGRFTFPGGGHYHASKYAVEAISDALRFEVRGFGVDVIVVEPGFILTGFGEHARTGAAGRRPVRGLRRRGQGGVRRDATRRARCGASAARPRRSPKRIAKAHHRDPPARPLHGHRLGQGADRPEGAAARRRLGRGHADDLPAARPGLIHRSSRRGRPSDPGRRRPLAQVLSLAMPPAPALRAPAARRRESRRRAAACA